MRRLKHPLLYTLAALLLLLAMTMTALRIAVGQLSEFRLQVEEVASRFIGQPLRIEGIDASLLGRHPSLDLTGVSLLDSESATPIAQFERLALSLDLFASLRQRAIVTRVALHGASLAVHRDQLGRIQLQGMGGHTDSGDDRQGELLLNWLLAMPQLSILDSQISWLDDRTAQQWLFQDIAIHMTNRPTRYQLAAQLRLPIALGDSLELALELHGDPHDPASWDLDGYLQLQQLQPAALPLPELAQWQWQQGSLNTQLWWRWQMGQLQELEGELSLEQPVLIQAEHRWALPALATRLHYQRQSSRLSPPVHRLHLDQLHWDEAQPPLALQLEYSPEEDGKLVAIADQLALDNLRVFFPLLQAQLPADSPSLDAWLTQGQARELYLHWQAGSLQGASVQLDRLSIQPVGKLPGIQNLHARLDYHQGRAAAHFHSEQLQLALPTLFRAPLPLQRTSGQLVLQQEGEAWRLFAHELQVASNDIKASGQAQFLFEPSQSPLLSIQAEFADAMASAVPNYLPTSIMPATAVAWLDQAFLTGRADNGRVNIYGRGNAFPFDDRNGRLDILFDADEVSLAFSPDWPVLDRVNGQVQFLNQGMHIHARYGQMFDARISATTATIKDFNRAMLEIRGKADSPAADGLRLLRESPIGRDMAILREAEGEGSVQVQLQLALPLSNKIPDSQQQIHGSVRFAHNQLRLLPAIVFDDVHGELNFKREQFSARDIQASFLGNRFSLDVMHQDQAPSQTLMIAHGRLDPESLAGHLPQQAWLQRLYGQSDWMGELRIPHNGDGSRLHFSSSALGIGMRLPMPLGKPLHEAMPINYELHFDGRLAGIHQLRVGQHLATRWQLDEQQQLRKLSLHLGSSQLPPLPAQEIIQITGSLDDLSAGQWLALLPPSRTASPTHSLPVVVQMQHLHLDASSQPSSPRGPGRPPYGSPVNIQIDDLYYGDIPLGQLALELKPQGPRRQIVERLSISAPHLELHGHGHWLDGQHTRMELSLQSEDFGAMLETLGFASVIRQGKGSAEATLQWPGSPVDYALATLDGQLTLTITDGVLEEARPGAGKLLGVLSLQALPRRLTLDFRDITDRGLHFKTLGGDFVLTGGNAYSKNMRIDTLPAQIMFTGRTGLLARDFDQEMIVVPQMRDTVSIMGALALGPQVGALLALVQNVFKRDIDAATMQRYRITGSWEQPDVVLINPATTE